MSKHLRAPIVPIGPSIAYMELSRGLFALIDSDSVARVSPFIWHAHYDPYTRSFYAIRHPPDGDQQARGMHSFITGHSPTDHINHDTLNNMRSNLRPCSRVQNAANRRLNRNSKTGYKGVSLENGKYRAAIRKNTRLVSLGTYVQAEDAAIAYDKAAINHFGTFAKLNFPERSHNELVQQ